MSVPSPKHPSTTLIVAAWSDPLVEAHGFGPGSDYIEFCWLPILGPTSTWLYRRLALLVLVDEPTEVDLVDLAQGLGLGQRLGRTGPLVRSLDRLLRFEVAKWDEQRLLVRRALAPLRLQLVERLGRTAAAHHVRLTAR